MSDTRESDALECRIYFQTQIKLTSGQNMSQPAFLCRGKTLSNISSICCFDDFIGIFWPNILQFCSCWFTPTGHLCRSLSRLVLCCTPPCNITYCIISSCPSLCLSQTVMNTQVVLFRSKRGIYNN